MSSRIRRRPPTRTSGPQPQARPTDIETADIGALTPSVDEVQAAKPGTSGRASASGSRRMSGASSRVSGRSSRRASAASAPATARSSRQLTPEQVAARRRSTWLAFKLIFLFIAVGGGAFALWWYVIRDTPEAKTARSALVHVQACIQAIERSVQDGEPKPAWEKFNEARKALDIPELAHADQNPNPDAPGLGSMAMAVKAYDLRVELEKSWKAKIERVERDRKADANIRQIEDGLAKLHQLDDASLAELGKQIDGFLANPVDPTAGRNETYIKDYPTLVTQIEAQKFKIPREIEGRHHFSTSQQEENARREADGFVKEEKFKDGLSMIAKYRDQYKDANFDEVESFIKAAAEKAWESAKTYSDNNYKTYMAPGTSEDFRAEALANANRRMQEVIDRFGLEEYTSQAAAALETYKR